jgi:hypothetical protein
MTPMKFLLCLDTNRIFDTMLTTARIITQKNIGPEIALEDTWLNATFRHDSK